MHFHFKNHTGAITFLLTVKNTLVKTGFTCLDRIIESYPLSLSQPPPVGRNSPTTPEEAYNRGRNEIQYYSNMIWSQLSIETTTNNEL